MVPILGERNFESGVNEKDLLVPIKKVSFFSQDIGSNRKMLYWYQYNAMPRRHRIFHDEIQYIAKALATIVEKKDVEEMKYGEGYALFKVLWRFKEHRTGPPHYPEVDEGVVSKLLVEVRRMFVTS